MHQILTDEIDWRIKCGARIIVSTPREDVGASMLIAEELSPKVNVPVEVVPMEELEKVLINSNNGTIVTSRYFLQPLEKVAKQYGCLLYTSPSPRDVRSSRMPSSA